MANPIPFDRLSTLRLQGGGNKAQKPALMQILRKLWRRKGLILGTAFFLLLLATVAVFMLTPLYTAQSLLILEAERLGPIDVEAVMAGMPSDAATIESETEVLKSRGLARKVVHQLGLEQVAEFNSTLEPPNLVSNIKSFINLSIVRPIVGLIAPEDPSAVMINPQDQIEVAVVDNYLDRLEVAPVGRSRAITVEFVSENPQLAARVVNTVAELYIVERLDQKLESTRKITDWLNARVSDLRRDVETKEQAVEEFRRKANLFRGERGEALLTQEVTELNTALSLARTQRSEAEAQLQQVRRLSARGQAASSDAVISNQLIQRLREEETRLQALVSEYATKYAPNHPRMRDATAQLSDVRRIIGNEVEKVARSLENQVAIARDRETALQARMRTLKTELSAGNSADVELRSLEQEATAARTLLDTFLARFISTSAQQDMVTKTPDARIVTYSDVPVDPSFPKKSVILFLALISATAVGVALAFVLEMMDTSFRSSDEVESETGAAVLGHVPLLSGWRARRLGLPNHVLRSPNSIATEALRRIATGITLAREDGGNNRILITSAQPGEGKTSIALGLARVQAAAGQRVLVIDADIRQAKVHSTLGLKAGPGLTDYLAAERTLEDVVSRDRHSSVHVITAGTTTVSSPQGIFTSERMRSLLEKAGQAYDLVIIDSPPVSAVSDALLLARFTSVLFVVRWGGAPRDVVISGMRQLVQTGSHLLGVVLSQVDPKRHVQYGYSDSGGYTTAVRKYYAKA